MTLVGCQKTIWSDPGCVSPDDSAEHLQDLQETDLRHQQFMFETCYLVAPKLSSPLADTEPAAMTGVAGHVSSVGSRSARSTGAAVV